MPGRGSICAFAQLQFRWQPFTLNAFPSAKYLLLQNAAELYATVQELGGNPVVEDKLPPGKSRAELNAAIETTISRVWSQIKEARAKRLTMPGM